MDEKRREVLKKLARAINQLHEALRLLVPYFTAKERGEDTDASVLAILEALELDLKQIFNEIKRLI